jgi:cytochrome c peroxidase
VLNWFRGVRAKLALAACCAVATYALAGCSEESAHKARVEQELRRATARPATREPLLPLPAPPKLDARFVALGRRLFHEPKLSGDGSLSCASCHDLANGGDDGRPLPRGVGGKTGLVNTATVYNAALNFVQFWDGRASTLEEQINGPLNNPLEMASSWPAVLGKLKADQGYVGEFAAIFPDGITEANVRRAIADFERTLITRGSPFDRFLEGDAGALDPLAKNGYETFKAVGCIACHQGSNVGGNMFQRFGVLGDYFKDRGNVVEADYGRYNVTKNEADRFVFRVPSLRNVEHTAPYFHDGSAATLEQAVQVMAKYQLGRKLADDQVKGILAFLRSLSGPMVGAQAGAAP